MKSLRKITGVALAAAIAMSSLASVPVSAESIPMTAEVTASEASATTYLTDSVISSSGYKTSYTSRYAYKTLSSSEKQLYKKIVAAAKNLEPTVVIPSGLSKSAVSKVFTIVFQNEPQLFWLDSNYYNSSNKYLLLQYKTMDIDEIEKMQTSINKTVKSLLTKAKKQSTTYGKLKVFYDYIVLNNNFVLESKGYNTTIYGAFTGSEDLQCAGYAKSMQYLCDLAGITSMVVTGTNKDGASHAWNIVKCGDGYYNLDTTWGDPINDYDENYIQYEFFLVPDSWIQNITHYNVGKFDIDGKMTTLYTPPKCTKTKYNYFIKNGINYTTAAKGYAALQSQIKKAVKSKTNVVEIRVTTKKVYEQLIGSSYQQKILKYAKSCSSNVKNVAVHTAYTKGSYVVHYDINYK